jgi:sensor histidine kinase YesM
MEKVDNITLQLDSLITKMDTVSSQLLASETLQKMFLKAGSSDYQAKNYFEYNIDARNTAQDILWTFNSPKRQVESINIFSNSSYVGLRYSPSVSRIEELSALSQWEVTDDKKYIVLGPHTDEWETLETKEVISLVRPFIATCYNFVDVGVIEVQEKYSKVQTICNVSSSEELELLVVDAERNVIYQSGQLGNDQIKSLTEACKDNQQDTLFKVSQDGVDLMVAQSSAKNAGWNVILIQPEDIYQQPIKENMFLILLLSLVVTAFILLFLRLLINNITKPILRLASDMDQVSHADRIPELHNTSIKEVQVLQNNFIQLMDRINNSTNELLVAKETEVNLRIMGLQAQINPHFLFNSLTAISAVAKDEKCKIVPIMCYQLSELFRYSSSSETNLVPVKSELDYIRTYLEFMKWRYEDNFHFDIVEKGDLTVVQVARLTLQPLVENCFTHGFKGTFPPYQLKIICEVHENGWNFFVADSGTGFGQPVIDKLSQEIYKIDEIIKSKHGYEYLKSQDMAILNIYIRLKLQYKDALCFEVIRDPELKGALVKILVDYRRMDNLKIDRV